MQLFDESWMQLTMAQWNRETQLTSQLKREHCNSTIGYGFIEHPEAQGFIQIVDGLCVNAGRYDGRELQFDLRAAEKNWRHWLKLETGITSFAIAYETGKLVLKQGSFNKLLARPALVNTLLKSFNRVAKTIKN